MQWVIAVMTNIVFTCASRVDGQSCHHPLISFACARDPAKVGGQDPTPRPMCYAVT